MNNWGKSSINGGLSIATFDYYRVQQISTHTIAQVRVIWLCFYWYHISILNWRIVCTSKYLSMSGKITAFVYWVKKKVTTLRILDSQSLGLAPQFSSFCVFEIGVPKKHWQLKTRWIGMKSVFHKSQNLIMKWQTHMRTMVLEYLPTLALKSPKCR